MCTVTGGIFVIFKCLDSAMYIAQANPALIAVREHTLAASQTLGNSWAPFFTGHNAKEEALVI